MLRLGDELTAVSGSAERARRMGDECDSSFKPPKPALAPLLDDSSFIWSACGSDRKADDDPATGVLAMLMADKCCCGELFCRAATVYG